MDDTPKLPEPVLGGSYTRDPVTGELTLVHRTKQAEEPTDEQDDEAQQSAPAQPAPGAPQE